MPLLRFFRMARHGVHKPNGAAGVVDAVPKPASGRDLILPLLKRSTLDRTGCELSTQRMLSFRAGSRIFGDALPCRPSIGGRRRAHQLPTAHGFARCVTKVPTRGRRWGSDAFLTLGHSASWVPHGTDTRLPRGEGTAFLSRRLSEGLA
jgi:hypothetical protein